MKIKHAKHYTIGPKPKPYTIGLLSKEVIDAFKLLKHDIVVCAIDHSAPFKLETDASDIAIAGVLNQNGRPVAYYSRTLQGSELKHPSIEKEASAIIECVRIGDISLLVNIFV